MFYQKCLNFSASFIKRFDVGFNSSYDIATPEILFDVQEIFDTSLLPGTQVISTEISLAQLQVNYFLPSLRTNPTPQISDLANQTTQKAQILEHKAKYNPATGHAIELSFFKRITTGGSWVQVARDYFYNLGGDSEQYLSIIRPFFTTDRDSLPLLGRGEKYGIRLSMGVMGPDDYITVTGSINAKIEAIGYAEFPSLYQQIGGVANTEAQLVADRSQRIYLAISNRGPGKLFIGFDGGAVSAQQTAWIEPDHTLVWEEGDITYTGDRAMAAYLKGSFVPADRVYVSSDEFANFGLIQGIVFLSNPGL